MSSIHYKFRSSVDYDTLTFEGPNISLKDLIDAIMLQKKIGKNSDFTLEVTNAQTKEVYQDQDFMVPRNTSVVVKRVPVARLAPVTGKVLDAEGKEVCRKSCKYENVLFVLMGCWTILKSYQCSYLFYYLITTQRLFVDFIAL